jgi:hypothetical protein
MPVFVFLAIRVLSLTGDPTVPWLSIERVRDRVVIQWSGGELQTSSGVPGQWVTLTNAASPLVIAPAASQQFFRLR